MQVLKRAGPLLRRAVGSTPTTAALEHPPPAVGLAKAVWSHTLAGEEKLTIDDHNTAIHRLKIKNEKEVDDLNNKFKKCLHEEKIRMSLAMVDMKCEIEKDANENYNKYCLDRANARNQLKVLFEKFLSHEIETSNICTQGTIIKFKNYCWSFGIATAFMIAGITKLFFKSNGKQ